MRNPWLTLPESAPYVLESDRAIVDAFNRVAGRKARLRTNLLPGPFIGKARTAPVVLLQLNPGFAGSEAHWHKRPDFAEAIRKNLAHKGADYPHFGLDPAWSKSPGGRWTTTRLRRIVEAVGDQQRVARRLAVVEFHGYHSERFRPIPVTLPSQYYGFDLVRRAIERGAVIVVMRGSDRWQIAVPELHGYSLAFRLRTVRSAYLTENTLGPRAFWTVVDALT